MRCRQDDAQRYGADPHLRGLVALFFVEKLEMGAMRKFKMKLKKARRENVPAYFTLKVV